MNVPEGETSREPDQALGQEPRLVRSQVCEPGQALGAGRHFHPPGPCRLYRVQGDQRDTYAAAVGRAGRAAAAGNPRGLHR